MTDVIELTDVPERFERWLAGRPLAQRSRREYARNAWLAVTPRPGWVAGRSAAGSAGA